MASDEREHHHSNDNESTAQGIAGAVGAAGGAMAGALAGTVAGALAGPLGMAAGGVAGAVLGGMTGRDASRGISMTVEESFWQKNHSSQSYASASAEHGWDDYAPAYQLGASARARYDHPDWHTVEPHLEREWESSRRNSRLDWPQARHASRAAWERVQNQLAQTMGEDAGTRR